MTRRAPVKITKSTLGSVDWAWRSPRYRALDFEFAARTMDPVLGSCLAELLEPFIVGDDPDAGTPVYSALDRGPLSRRRYAIYFGSRYLASGFGPSLPLAQLLWSLNQNVARTARGCLLLHASAAEYNGTAVVMPASSGSGKSTTVAGLVRSGFRYVTDEAVAVTIGSLTLRPFPKPLSIDPGSWSVLPELAPRGDDVAALTETQWQVPPRSIRPDAIAPPCSPRLIVAPSYRPDQPTELLPVSAASAVLLLANNSFNFSRLGNQGFDTAVALARQARGYQLFVGDLDDGVRCIRELVESISPDSATA